MGLLYMWQTYSRHEPSVYVGDLQWGWAFRVCRRLTGVMGLLCMQENYCGVGPYVYVGDLQWGWAFCVCRRLTVGKMASVYVEDLQW